MEYTATIEEENKEIANRYKDLLKGTYEVLSKEDKEKFLKENEINIRQCLGEAVPTQVFKSIAKKIYAIEN